MVVHRAAIVVLACLVGALAVPWASAAVRDERPLAPGQVFYLRLEAGSVQIAPGPPAKVGVQADLAPGQGLRWRDAPGRLVLVVDDRERLSPREAQLVLAVPPDNDLVLELGDASLVLDDVGGRRLVVRGGRGDVRVSSAAEAIDIATVQGRIEVPRVTGRLRTGSVGGDQVVEARGPADIEAETVAGRLQLQTTGARRLKANSVSGAIEARLADTAGLRAFLESLSGPIEVGLAAGQGLVVEVAQASGEIELTETLVQQPDGRFVAGGGDGALRLDSFSGPLRVRMLDAASSPAPTPSVRP